MKNISDELKLLICIFVGFFSCAFAAMTIEERCRDKKPILYFAGPGVSVEIEIFLPEVERPGQTKIG